MSDPPLIARQPAAGMAAAGEDLWSATPRENFLRERKEGRERERGSLAGGVALWHVSMSHPMGEKEREQGEAKKEGESPRAGKGLSCAKVSHKASGKKLSPCTFLKLSAVEGEIFYWRVKSSVFDVKLPPPVAPQTNGTLSMRTQTHLTSSGDGPFPWGMPFTF